jgi:hypothetical protein
MDWIQTSFAVKKMVLAQFIEDDRWWWLLKADMISRHTFPTSGY